MRRWGIIHEFLLYLRADSHPIDTLIPCRPCLAILLQRPSLCSRPIPLRLSHAISVSLCYCTRTYLWPPDVFEAAKLEPLENHRRPTWRSPRRAAVRTRMAPLSFPFTNSCVTGSASASVLVRRRENVNMFSRSERYEKSEESESDFAVSPFDLVHPLTRRDE